jgi:hypothetical protein
MKSKTDIANDILSRQLSWISSADNKVSPIFAINAAMLGALAALMSSFHNWLILNSIMTTLSIIFLLGSMVCLTLATFPRLSGPKGSLVYFGGIVTKSLESYTSEVINIDDDALLKDIITQVYRNAEIANTKFNYVKMAMIQTFASFPLWAIAIWFLYR